MKIRFQRYLKRAGKTVKKGYSIRFQTEKFLFAVGLKFTMKDQKWLWYRFYGIILGQELHIGPFMIGYAYYPEGVEIKK